MEQPEEDSLLAQLRASGSVFAEEELAELQQLADEEDPWQLQLAVERRTLGEPIEHIVGSAAFAEIRVAVHQGVFVPRRRTVLLATIVAERLAELTAARPARPPRLLDLGCGTGAIAALAMHRVPGVEVVAFDADALAVACARTNLPGAFVTRASSIAAMLEAGSAAQERGRPDVDRPDPDRPDPDRAARPDASADLTSPFDVIAANLPYVPTEQLVLLPRDATEWEPALALDGGWDGLDPLGEHSLAMAGSLRTGGIAVTEVAPQQVELATEILELAGFVSVEERTDEAIGATVLVATR